MQNIIENIKGSSSTEQPVINLIGQHQSTEENMSSNKYCIVALSYTATTTFYQFQILFSIYHDILHEDRTHQVFYYFSVLY